MYRFLGVPTFTFQRTSSVSKCASMQRTVRLCSFCNFYHGRVSKSVIYLQTRGSVSTINPLSLCTPVKKKTKQRLKKYAELLEVTDNATSNRKAAIHKLNAADVSVLVNEQDITMDKLHKLKNTVSQKGTNVRSERKNVASDDVGASGLNFYNPSQDPFREGNFSCSEWETEPLFQPKQPPQKGAKPDKQPKHTADSVRQKSTEFINDLEAHMAVYLDCGMTAMAYKALKMYRKSATSHSRQICPRSIRLYNLLLEDFSSRGEIQQAFEVYDLLKQDSLVPSPQTYAIMLTLFGRHDISTEQIKERLTDLNLDMSKSKISFDTIFNDTRFKQNQLEYVLKAVRLLKPGFRPSFTPPQIIYTSKLLKKIPMLSNYESPAKGIFTIEELRDLFKLQIEAECNNEIEVKSIEKATGDKETLKIRRDKVVALENLWRQKAEIAFDKNLKYLKRKENSSHSLFRLHPFLEVLEKKHYVDAIIREVRQIAQGSEFYSMALPLLYIVLGQFIYKQYEIKTNRDNGVLDKMIDVYLRYLRWYLNPNTMENSKNINNRIAWQLLEHEEKNHGASLDRAPIQWPKRVIISIGKFLYNIILHDIKLDPEIMSSSELRQATPAFYTLFRNQEKFLVEQLKPHPLISKLYRDSQPETLTFESVLLPSYSPPRPWCAVNSGGYLITQTTFIRCPHNSTAPLTKVQNTSANQLYPVFDSLDQLGSIPWTTNSRVLDIAIKVFQDGGSEKLNVPQPPTALPPLPKLNSNATKKEQGKLAKLIMQTNRKKGEMYSLWCDTLYKLSLANHFREKVFWLPHNMDFRGRVYPVPPHLNHLASDLGRSLLLFAKGKPLGPKGLDWLMIHAINLTGLKKGSSVRDCLQYANENLDNILDSAREPLTGNMWWAKSDEPWQTLAACMEIEAALKAPNIEEYESKFPVHQDGSCNGLQHYAALGRDQIGAESVNLYPFNIPQDVYTAVASIVEEKRKIDATRGHEIAKSLEGFVKRKIIKQTVMTTVYGVTKYGAKQQVIRQLKDTENFPAEQVWPASAYLVEKTFESLKSMFTSAREIQEWFTECARKISYDLEQNVEWITPLGLPVVQAYTKYTKSNRKPAATSAEENSHRKPDAQKQRNAFAPNFIHSLDSTHMMLTSLHCSRAGLTFVSVHDCFWTHACTVDVMNKICREQFVALHSEPILEELSKFFVQYYVGPNSGKTLTSQQRRELETCLRRVPQKGNFDINNVLSSIYFFS